MDEKFQVNLGGLIDILANHLYSGPQVYLRELLQNATDAIRARKARADADFDPTVRVSLVTPETKAPILTFEDNGIGLTEDDIVRFLATVGMSSKQQIIERDVDFIGRFGIGLLSCFMVCDEIVVITRSHGADSRTIQWTGKADGTYETKLLDSTAAIGTQVFIRARVDAYEYFSPQFVRKSLAKYGEFLGSQIRFEHDGNVEELHRVPPWARTNQQPADVDELNEASERLQCRLIDGFPIDVVVGEDAEIACQGMAYVTAQPSAMATKRPHTIYLKGMLLSESVDNLLPDWAFFLRIIANVNGLQPTASRESFIENHDFEALRQALGDALRSQLLATAQERPQVFRELLGLHHAAIKTLCVDDPECLRLFAPWLPFETTQGTRTLRELEQSGVSLRYARTVDEFRRVEAIIKAQGGLLINAGYTHDAAVLSRLSQLNREVSIEPMDVESIASDFDSIDLAKHSQAEALKQAADKVLERFDCNAVIAGFEPSDLPALYFSDATSDFLRELEETSEGADELWSGMLNNLADSIGKQPKTTLYLNWHNSLVQRLANNFNLKTGHCVIEMLYCQALLQGHHRFGATERETLQSATNQLISQAFSN